MANNKKKKTIKFTRSMRMKLAVLFGGVVVLFCGLIGRLMYIEHTSGDKYTKIILGQQGYDSKIIPYKRGDIVDCKGSILATSIDVYNVILDCSVLTSNEEGKYIEPTITALLECFPDLDMETLYSYAAEQKDSRYIILKSKLPYEEIQPFIEKTEAVDEKGKKINPNIKGVWFEKEYQRIYPKGPLASSVIGFTSSGNVGTIGLENYYNDVLNGTNGREYGYLNSDNNYEKNIINAEDGNRIVTSIDANVQSVVEQKILEFNEAYRDNAREGDGSLNTAVIIMNPNNGEIIAMAEYPSFDLSDPRDLSAYYTEEELEAMTEKQRMDALNAIWQNFCVTHTYEPGSVQKPFTVATGLETGTITTDMTFFCDGGEQVSDHWVGCAKRDGHGLETVEGSIMDSCNDALMQMSYLIQAENFANYQSIFGFGQRCGIDLPGETNTAGLIHTLDNMSNIDLATNVFGQNYNCTMVQMAGSFCSLINGGMYYQPHLVTKITDEAGNTISTVEPTVMKQTISQSTSRQLMEYMYHTVSAGSAGIAKVDGYSMGGKTGTAQKYPRGTGDYLVSFIGYLPQENPQILIYCIVDTPNTDDQPHSSFAQNIVREILKEILPYMNIYQDEELTGKNEFLNIKGEDTRLLGQEPNDPAADPNNPAAEPQDPAADPNNPAAEPQDPAAEPSDPAAEPQDPAAEPSDPAAEPQDPAAEPNDPAADPNNPAAEPNDPAAEPNGPAAEPDYPASMPNDPAAEPQDSAAGADDPA